MTTSIKLKFSQFIDLLLARLYEAQRQNPDGMVDLNEIAADLRESVPDDWVVDAAKVMQARGLADCIISYGACHARLTGEGMLFVEEDRGSGIIRQYRQEPAQFFQHVHVSGSGHHQVIVGSSQTGITQSSTGEQERPHAWVGGKRGVHRRRRVSAAANEKAGAEPVGRCRDPRANGPNRVGGGTGRHADQNAELSLIGLFSPEDWRGHRRNS